MVRTRVGYTGGTTADPTYRRLGDHTEAVEVEFDPRRLGYRDLVEVFWEEHDPGRKSFSRQYLTALFPRGDGQRRIAVESAREPGPDVGNRSPLT